MTAIHVMLKPEVMLHVVALALGIVGVGLVVVGDVLANSTPRGGPLAGDEVHPPRDGTR